MEVYFKSQKLSLGYGGKTIIRDLSFDLAKGSILTLIGPNGGGKSTILKALTRQLKAQAGAVYLEQKDLQSWSRSDLARNLALVLTDRLRPDLLTGRDLVAMGRYPYTGRLGRLSDRDWQIVDHSLAKLGAEDLAGIYFDQLSDGQKQKIILARALCQEAEVLVLDEPTAYLDIRHKLDLLRLLRRLSRQEGLTVIMSLHEVDLAIKVSDYILCVKGQEIQAFGPTDQVLNPELIQELYDLDQVSYELAFGSAPVRDELSVRDLDPASRKEV